MVSQTHHGTIVFLHPDPCKRFGFVRLRDGDRRRVFFHELDLADDLQFGPALFEREVQFELQSSPKGEKASKVRAAR